MKEVVWAIIWSTIAGLGVIGVVWAAAVTQVASNDAQYFRGSAQLWAFAGGVVAAMSVAMAPSLMRMGGYPPSARGVVFGCIALPAVVAVFACWHNAWALRSVRRRRSDALLHGEEFEAVVVEREHKPFAHDILAVTLEARLPADDELDHHGGYRIEATSGTRTLRLVETCPGDQWSRLSPGRHVRIRIDPRDTSRYALVLFEAA